ncbi:DUF5830 family protein [Natrinema versiforme]|uniref:Uncharacterized protein n=1 Tax=Natrinema versiforme JCM 10478 TaxID=1227496 RepID=L9XQ75_9EURY|nr:DUF5830 family protein [Natrinema versiforme]ELY63925.1 hypothetical protein C489_17797 [Natrinema versiforme JCM 10478]
MSRDGDRTERKGESSVDPPLEADDDRVELGLALLARLEHESLSLADAVDRIETVTADPTVTRTILDQAELRGIIERDDGIVRPKSSQYVRFERDVITKEGEFSCRRCGSGLSTGYFIDLEAGELGPFGSSCIRKVTGRDD